MNTQLLLTAVGAFSLLASNSVAQVKISELDCDTPTAPVNDSLEFIELSDGGVGNTPLTGFVLVFYNGSNDASYAAFDLDGFSTDANGLFLMGNPGVTPAPSITWANNTLQNGADAVALYAGNASDFPNNTPVTNVNLIDALVYGTADAEDTGLTAVLGGPQADESALGDSTTASIGRICFDAGFITMTPPSPGADNGDCGTDTDGDGIPDKTDNCPTIANPDQTDCNDNLIGDVCEIAKDPSQDCNENGTLDSCEPDCNQTGVPDDCDIANGTSEDVNSNGVPDECEVASTMVLNEIHADPHLTEGDANNDGLVNAGQDEFVELVNISAGTLDLSGWTIRNGSPEIIVHTFPAGTLVPAQCGIVVFSGGAPIGQFGGCEVQVSSSGTGLSLDNSADTITIRNGGGLLVDTHTWGAEGNADVSLTRTPDITGPFMAHPAPPRFSPGTKLDGAVFGGCPPVLPDTDGDGIPDVDDNCDTVANPQQQDCDEDGIGDACDTDPDKNGNGIPDVCEVEAPDVVINEVRIDQTGTDNDEYFELRGAGGTSLAGLTYLVIGDGPGGSGEIESVTSLQGHVIPADGHFLAAEPTFTMGTPDFTTAPSNLNFENGDQVTHVLVANFTGSLGDDLDTNDDGMLDVIPWGATVDAVGLILAPLPPPAGEVWAYGAALGFEDVGPDATFVPGHVFRCQTAGDWTIGLFNPGDPNANDTPGVTNDPCPAPPCPTDINGDGVTNVSDLLSVIANWGATSGPHDVNGDGIVNVSDLLTVIANWGPCR